MSDNPIESNEREFAALKSRIQTELLARLDPETRDNPPPQARDGIEELFETILSEIQSRENVVLSRPERHQIHDSILGYIFGFGPLEELLMDENVQQILVNDYKNVYVVRGGIRTLTDVHFNSDEHLLKTLDRILSRRGERLDESHPLVRVTFADGTRLHAVTIPVNVHGTAITISRPSGKPLLTLVDLLNNGTMTTQVAGFLRACIIQRLNIVVSAGDGGSGKTTLLNVLANLIPNDQRIVTIESSVAELQLKQEQVISLMTRPPNVQGKGEVPLDELIKNAVYMAPDRIVLGGCNGGETLELLTAMNNRIVGSMMAVTSNSPRDALGRLEAMCMMSEPEWPPRTIRQVIASAVNIIVQQDKMRDGSRKIVKVTEVQGLEGDKIVTSDIFEFGRAMENGIEVERLQPTGSRPKILDQIEDFDWKLPPSLWPE